MRLEIELIPKPLWGKSLAKMLPKDTWWRIKVERIREKGKRCEICSSLGNVELHERWRYDDERHVQHLEGVILLCRKCHSIKHWGRTSIMAEQGEINLQEMVDHFCGVNECGPETLARHEQECMARWRERSRHAWTQDLGRFGWDPCVP